jgi:DNA topoisomerase-1
MKKSLVIVESPAKSKTLEKYLGKNFVVAASLGHVKDLPPNSLGVDVENDFCPQYEIIDGKEKALERIKKLAKTAETIYLAPDPDREGEAIAWHIAEEIHNRKNNIFRVTFNEITKRAVLEGIKNAGQLNPDLFEAQQARRVLDRLVGYKISPILWKKIQKGLSAGRVQSVAVRLVCEREQEIENFVAQEYWTIDAKVEASEPPPFVLRLAEIDGKKQTVRNKEDAATIVSDLKGADFRVSKIEKKEVKWHPWAPFITSTLQQEAARKLHFSPARTMMIAQKLYEGVELGDLGATGLITYMRTDSVRVADEAVQEVRKYVREKFSPDYLSPKPNTFRNRRLSQDAHEAIRPTSLDLSPDSVQSFLTKDQLAIYTLVWNRFVASQMADAVMEQTRIESLVKKRYLFSATGMTTIFPGFLSVYEEGKDDADEDDPGLKQDKRKLPAVKEGERLRLLEITPSQRFTKPPARFTESSLVKELERRGIGRPSTYATIISIIQEKKYVGKERGSFKPTELGRLVTDLLIQNFPQIMDIKFTAIMEEQLDKVEEGAVNWVELLKNFYLLFRKQLSDAVHKMRDVRREYETTTIKCEKCGAQMIVRWGKTGKFLACPNYPKCRNTKSYVSDEQGNIKIIHGIETEQRCEKCGRKMVIKTGRKGRFLACPGYPECKNSKPLSVGVACPKEGCDGQLIERQSKKGKVFYACSRYPKCRYIVWEKPVNERCPTCDHPFLVMAKKNGVVIVKCPAAECGFSRRMDILAENEKGAEE